MKRKRAASTPRPPTSKGSITARDKKVPPEWVEANMLASHLRSLNLLFTAIPEMAHRRLNVTKNKGYAKGTPDYVIFEPSRGYHGLCIELKKRKGGVESPEQQQFIVELEKRKYKAAFCKGWYEAAELVHWYLCMDEEPDEIGDCTKK